MRGRKAFTLVELLVVIGIIAVLLSILIPVLAGARERANRLSCLSNMRQLGTSFIMYATDNNCVLPLGGKNSDTRNWILYYGGNLNDGALVRYQGGTFNPILYRCKAVPDINNEFDARGGTAYPYSYAMNTQLQGFKTTRIRNSSQVIILVEDQLRNDSIFWWFANGQSTFSDGSSNPYAGYMPDLFAFRHANGKLGNVAFADGHAQSLDVSHQNDPNWYNAYPGQPPNATSGPAQ